MNYADLIARVDHLLKSARGRDAATLIEKLTATEVPHEWRWPLARLCRRAGRPYNQLLITIAQAMGLRAADYEIGGATGFGAYGSRTAGFDHLGNHRRETLPTLV